MYVDAAYCYRPSSMVCWFVCLSVGLSVTVVSSTKMDELIEMLFGMWAQMGPDPPMRRGNLRGERRPILS